MSTLEIDGTEFNINSVDDRQKLQDQTEFETASITSCCIYCTESFTREYSYKFPKEISIECTECENEQTITEYEYHLPAGVLARHLRKFDSKRDAYQYGKQKSSSDLVKQVSRTRKFSRLKTVSLLTGMIALGLIIFYQPSNSIITPVFGTAVFGYIGGMVGTYYYMAKLTTAIDIDIFDAEILQYLSQGLQS
jgi:hypothetical protein